MIINKITQRSDDIINILLKVWEQAVRATHLFLTEEDIQKIFDYVPGALLTIPNLIVAQDADFNFVAFMGIADRKLEMLFVSPEKQGKGIGKQLVAYGIENFAVNEVCVNEQNPQAVGFYEHMGFIVTKRTDQDEQGGPFPLLYMIRY